MGEPIRELLSFLLSRTFDGALTAEHQTDLERSTITPETAQAQFIRSVPPAMIAPLLGFDPQGIRSALLFPFRSPDGGFMDHVRVKVFPPLTDREGHAIKYLQPRNSRPRLYFVASVLPEACHDGGTLSIVEGEKKTLALAQLGVPAVGICGVEGWHYAGSRDLLRDFDYLTLDRRPVELFPDGDVATNPNVARAVERFAQALEKRGARVKLVVLPPTGAQA
jgi:hypothetical protein